MTDRTVREQIATRLFRAEEEYREAFAAVHRDGSDAARARYAAARKELDAADAASMVVLASPDNVGSASYALFQRSAVERA